MCMFYSINQEYYIIHSILYFQKPDSLFGNDPFAPSSSMSQSPTPALPPKQKKTAPPRPAPPKNRLTPSPSPNKIPTDNFGGFSSDPFAGADPFANSATDNSAPSTGSDAFANFADFSPSKVSFHFCVQSLF